MTFYDRIGNRREIPVFAAGTFNFRFEAERFIPFFQTMGLITASVLLFAFKPFGEYVLPSSKERPE